MTRARWRLLGVVALVLIAVVTAALGGSGGGDGERVDAGSTTTTPSAVVASTGTAVPSTAGSTPTTAATVRTATTTSAPAATRTTLAVGLDLVALSRLPAEAADTWALIVDGGPFPYDRDGVTFENRERILPRRERGFYREYTVPTPGEDDRGARRLVVGEDDAVFYTGDHYDSFVQVDVEQ